MKRNLLFLVIILINILLLGITFFADVYEFPDDKAVSNIDYDAVDLLKMIFLLLSFINFIYFIFNIIKSKILNLKNLIILFLFIFCLIELLRMLWFSSGLIGE